MPWSIKADKGRYYVVDSDGKRLKGYATRSEAQRYQRALYANAPERSLAKRLRR